MSTVRLFETDPYQTGFDAVVLEVMPAADGLAVILDRTLFYPESGGQPCDTGRLADARVTGVQEDADTGRILHLTRGVFQPGERVTGEIDGARRFDHMQQHSGQHLLSAAFLEMLGAKTVGFHLGENVSTLDFALEPPSVQQLNNAERRANEIVFANRPVSTRRAAAEQIAALGLRKKPPALPEIRIVDFDGFDRTACCGTHVVRTGEIGLIKVLNCEKLRGGSRITFVCGGRALEHFQSAAGILQAACRTLTVAEQEFSGRIEALLDEQRSAKRDIKALKLRVNAMEAGKLLAGKQKCGEYSLVSAVLEDGSVKDLQYLVRSLCAGDAVVCILGLRHEKGSVIAGKAAGVHLCLKEIIGAAQSELDGKGGGNEFLVQTHGADPGRVAAAVEAAVRTARKMTER